MSVTAKRKIKRPGKKRATKRDFSVSYNKYKEFDGKQYTGMKVGRTHKWYYDKGEWKEKKSLLIFGKFPTQSPSAGPGKHRRAPAFPWTQNITGTSFRTRM